MARPSKFKPTFCNEVIETMATGLSLTAFAGEIGVARSTINEWMGEHPEFSEAVKVAKAKRTMALEKQFLASSDRAVVTSRIFALKNADPDEWREKQHVEHSVNDDLAERMLRYRARADG